MKQDKLLFLGNSIGTKDAIAYAKKLGVTTIMTDYLTPEENPEKHLTDEYWMIDVEDLDALESQCRKEQVTGVFAATSEFCLTQAGTLCKRLGLPFYASEKGWRASQDKKYFKECCQRFGLDTPKEYDPEHACCPVIIKPVDSCAQQGLSICHNQDELAMGLKKGREASQRGQVIVEEYITGREVGVIYIFRDGVPHFVALPESLYFMVSGRNNWSRYVFHKEFYEEYMREIEPKVQELLRYLECREGVCYFQMMYRDGTYYFLELGYRLDAIGTWRITEKMTGASTLEWQVLHALGKRPEDIIPAPKIEDKDGKIGAVCFIWGKPGRVASIEGLDQVKAMDGVEVFQENITIGTEIPTETSLRQVAYILSVTAQGKDALIDVIRRVKECLHAYDASGAELLLCPEE